MGKYQFPLGRADVRLLRKSRPFWSILTEHGIFSCVIRVPISFPPEKLHGVQLSAMCVPDLRGHAGDVLLLHDPSRTGPEAGRRHSPCGRAERRHGPRGARRSGECVRADAAVLKLPFLVTIRDERVAVLKINGANTELRKGEYTDWIKVCFRAAPGVGIHGICKFLLVGAGAEFDLYVTPVNIDPDRPALPVSYPSVYARYLAKRQGPYGTLGLAEDTWALNEHWLTDEQFIQQSVNLDREREADVLRRPGQSPARALRVRVRRRGPASSTPFGGISTCAIRPTPGGCRETVATWSRTFTGEWTRWWAGPGKVPPAMERS